jgi:hypothetical protein
MLKVKSDFSLEEQRNKKDRNSYFNLRSYLNETDDLMMYGEGNTILHQASRLDEIKILENQATINPHLLFILIQMGMHFLIWLFLKERKIELNYY